MEKIPETAADISPYATSDFQTMPMNSTGSGSGGLGRNTIGRKETLRMTDYNKHKLSHPDIACSLTSRPHRVTSLFHCDQELIEDISGYSRGWLEVRETGKEAATKIFRE